MKLQKPRGTQDVYYEKARELSTLEFILRRIAIEYNFSEIRTPIFESKDLFMHSIGLETDIISKEMFELFDKKKRVFVLRPEGTVPVIRSIIEDKIYRKYELPLKLFYIGNMFRYERPQYGRLRQFNQFGVEAVGIKSCLLDVEIILFGLNLLKTIGLEKIILKINYLTTGITLTKYLALLIDFFQKKKLCFKCQNRLKKSPLRVLECKIDYDKFVNAPKIYNYLTPAENEEFNEIQNILIKLGISFYLDFQLVRGLDYYTGIIFEIMIDNKEKNLTLIGGGRYDKLINIFEPNLDYPAIGFALGLERLLLILADYNIILSDEYYIDVYLICLSKNAYYFVSSLLLLLRKNGFKVNCNYLIKNIKIHFRLLSKLNVTNAIIIGDKELKKNIVKIKNQKTGKEKEVKFENIILFLNEEKK